MGQHCIDKYSYLIEEIIKDQNRETAFLVDGAQTSFRSWGIGKRFFPKALAAAECRLWMKIHKIKPRQIKLFYSTKELDPQNDVLFIFSRNQLNGPGGPDINDFTGLTVVHVTHYISGTRQIADKTRAMRFPLMAAEADLARNDFFKYWWPKVKKVYVLPFVVKPRYKKINQDFKARKNKCFAIGTIFDAGGYPEYRQFFKDKPFHPMRDAVYEKQLELREAIDSYISKEAKTSEELRGIKPSDSRIVSEIKRRLPYFILEKFIASHRRDYYRFDIVAKYNEYRMFISPEESIGLPSINVLEGMACGCAYIGVESPMYSDLGMRSGVHYVGYREEDIEDLRVKIKYYQDHEDELKKIAEAGYELAQQYRGRSVAARLWRDLDRKRELLIEGKDYVVE